MRNTIHAHLWTLLATFVVMSPVLLLAQSAPDRSRGPRPPAPDEVTPTPRERYVPPPVEPGAPLFVEIAVLEGRYEMFNALALVAPNNGKFEMSREMGEFEAEVSLHLMQVDGDRALIHYTLEFEFEGAQAEDRRQPSADNEEGSSVEMAFSGLTSLPIGQRQLIARTNEVSITAIAYPATRGMVPPLNPPGYSPPAPPPDGRLSPPPDARYRPDASADQKADFSSDRRGGSAPQTAPAMPREPAAAMDGPAERGIVIEPGEEEGVALFNGREMSMGQLRKTLEVIHKASPQMPVEVRAAATAPHGSVMAILAAAKDAGFADVRFRSVSPAQ